MLPQTLANNSLIRHRELAPTKVEYRGATDEKQRVLFQVKDPVPSGNFPGMRRGYCRVNIPTTVTGLDGNDVQSQITIAIELALPEGMPDSDFIEALRLVTGSGTAGYDAGSDGSLLGLPVDLDSPGDGAFDTAKLVTWAGNAPVLHMLATLSV
jgi:hypothetical protein